MWWISFFEFHHGNPKIGIWKFPLLSLQCLLKLCVVLCCYWLVLLFCVLQEPNNKKLLFPGARSWSYSALIPTQERFTLCWPWKCLESSGPSWPLGWQGGPKTTSWWAAIRGASSFWSTSPPRTCLRRSIRRPLARVDVAESFLASTWLWTQRAVPSWSVSLSVSLCSHYFYFLSCGYLFWSKILPVIIGIVSQAVF